MEGATTLSITTLSISDTQHTMLCHCSECRYGECRVLFTVMLTVIMLSVIMLNVVMQSVVMLSVVAPSGALMLEHSCLLNLSYSDLPCHKHSSLFVLSFMGKEKIVTTTLSRMFLVFASTNRQAGGCIIKLITAVIYGFP